MRKLPYPLLLILITFTIPSCLGSLDELEVPTQTPYIIVVTPTPIQPTETAIGTSQTEGQDKQLARVVEVVDGDSIRVDIDGFEYPVR